MTASKANVVGLLGERDLLLPQLVQDALAANGRAKYLFSLLQLARSHADVGGDAPDLRRERELAGVDDSRLDAVVRDSCLGRDADYHVPLAGTIVERVFHEIGEMLAPLRAAGTSRLDPAVEAAFERRVAMLSTASLPRSEAELPREAITLLTSSERDRGDSAHLLVLDLHRAIDALAATFTTDDVAGARVYGLEPDDRLLVEAFMAGLHRTEGLKLGHPGLGTLATRRGPVLILENDIGETAAHVLVVHVEGMRVTITTTEVHLPRLDFFRRLLEGHRLVWGDVRSRSLRELGDGGVFYEWVGTLDARDREELARFLEHLGSRLVFLIDWNRARKTLRAFVSKAASLELLDWAAKKELGHRAFLEMGGDRLLYDVMAAVIRTPLRFGERLDDVLGAEPATELVRFAVRASSLGLRSGRSKSLIRAEIRAELARRWRAAGERLLGPVLEHATIVAEMARGLRDQLRGLGRLSEVDQDALVRAAKEREHRGDELVGALRGIAARMPNAEAFLRVAERADDAADALEEAAFLISLVVRVPSAPAAMAFAELGDLVVSAAEAYLACVAAAREPASEGRAGILEAFDAVLALEHRMDEAERRAVARLGRDGAIDGKVFVIASQVVGAAEQAVDSLTRASLALRDRVSGVG